MATLSFEGETHQEIVQQVRAWLASADRNPLAEGAKEAVDLAADLTGDALKVLAEAAPASVAESDLVKTLVRMGHDSNELTRRSLLASLDAISDASGGALVQRMEKARDAVAYEMSSAVAKQLLRTLTGR